MAWLRETFPYLNDPLWAAVFWIIAAILTYAFFTWLIPFLTKKSKTEIDDIIIGVLRLPVIIILTAYAILDVLSLFEQIAVWLEVLHKIYLFVLIWASTWLLFRLIRDVVAEYVTGYAEESESSLDDVLIPLITKAGPFVIFIMALLTTVGVFSPELLGELLTVIGALSFLLIFLFQEPLSNLFSGVYLWIDTPFRIKDLVLLEDGTFYRIEKIGSRVSELYNTEAHTVAFFPNNKLAEQRLINITKPSVELRQGIDIGIAYKHSYDEIESAQTLLSELANRHVHVLGPWDEPGEGIRAKKELLDEDIKAARQVGTQEALERVKALEDHKERLRLEYKMRDENQRIWEDIKALSALVSALEDKGLARKEREFTGHLLGEIKNNVLIMRRDLTVWAHWSGILQASYQYGGSDKVEIDFQDIENSVVTVDEWLGLLEKHYDARIAWLQERMKIPLIGEFHPKEEISLLGGDIFHRAYLLEKKYKKSASEFHGVSLRVNDRERTNMQQFLKSAELFEDYVYLLKSWSSTTRSIVKGINRVENMLNHGSTAEFRIDSELEKIGDIFSSRFMLKVPGFRYPDAGFQKYGESSIDFRLEFFVDDLVGEHFERVGNVVSEVGIMIKQHFDVRKIEIPFPQRDVWFHNLSQEITTSNLVVQPRRSRKANK